MRGHALTPLYPAATILPLTAPETYRLLTLFDALRAGRARGNNLAREQLRSAIRASVWSRSRDGFSQFDGTHRARCVTV